MLPRKSDFLPRRLLPLRTVLRSLPVGDSAALGTLILGAPGVGKTLLEALLLLCYLIRGLADGRGLPGCVLDPLGTLSDAFLFRLLCFLSEYPQGDDEFFWQRLCYIELGRTCGVSFPLYYQREGESLFDAGNRLIVVLERANPQLVTGSPLTWPAARRLALNAGMLFTSLGEPGLLKLEDLLFNTIDWDKSGTFQRAINRNPEAAAAVLYFREQYLPLPKSEKSRIAGTLLDQVSPLLADPKLRLLFGGDTPRFDWEEVEATRQLVFINGKGISDPATRLFASHWILESLFGHLRKRGRRSLPFVLMIDEFAHLGGAWTTDNKPVADLFDEFLAQFARNSRVFVTAALQSADQADERLARTLFRMGTLVTGRAGSFREARTVADHLFQKDINRVQHYTKTWGKLDPLPRSYGYPYTDLFPFPTLAGYFVLDEDPQFMGLDLQTEEAAGLIQKLPALEFLCRRSVSEGTVSQEVSSLALAPAIIDPDTGQYQFPDPEQDASLILQIQQRLAARTGLPRAAGEGSERQRESAPIKSGLDSRTAKEPKPCSTAPDTHGLPVPQTGQHPRNPKETRDETRSEIPPSRPTLTEQEKALLAFLIEQPDTPISAVYNALSLSWWTGNKLRDSLAREGYLTEIAIREGNVGRPVKFLLPTFLAFSLLEKDPPKGRGGSIHRYIQHRVCDGARAKGYSARLEYQLPTGAIVDVHLERKSDFQKGGEERIAVEIAVLSTPEREIHHLRECLAANYDKVFTVFADENLLQKTQEALAQVFSAEELGKVRLLPVGKLSVLGA